MDHPQGLSAQDRVTTISLTHRLASAWGLALLLSCGGLLLGVPTERAAAHDPRIQFDTVRSAKAEADGCLVGATARVTVTAKTGAETLEIKLSGMPPNTEFNVFVIQLPNSPFGLSWYQGDIETDDHGKGHGKFVGRFSIETFVVAPGVGAAPVVHAADAAQNPQTAPVHMYHLGLWFDSPDDAAAAGCSNTVTPFNGDHTAGIQALSTKNFPDGAGPLRQLE
jgi:hypothetical protein